VGLTEYIPIIAIVLTIMGTVVTSFVTEIQIFQVNPEYEIKVLNENFPVVKSKELMITNTGLVQADNAIMYVIMGRFEPIVTRKTAKKKVVKRKTAAKKAAPERRSEAAKKSWVTRRKNTKKKAAAKAKMVVKKKKTRAAKKKTAKKAVKKNSKGRGMKLSPSQRKVLKKS